MPSHFYSRRYDDLNIPLQCYSIHVAKSLSLHYIDSLAIDEADLILSYGHDEDVRAILNGTHLPKVYQSFLMSATITKDVEALKGLVLRNPVIVNYKLTPTLISCGF